MGLDVTHIHLTLEPNDRYHFLYVDDWDCNVSLENYSKYIRTIDDLDFNRYIAIVKNEEDFEKFNTLEWSNLYLKAFIGDFDEKMKAEVSRFIVNQKLDSLESLHLTSKVDGIEYNTISFGEPIKVQGIYYIDEIGYQRKGMSNLFYGTFKKHLFWGEKEDFELAYACVGDERYLEHFGKMIVDEMKMNFKENFIDKFEFGKSLLCASF